VVVVDGGPRATVRGCSSGLRGLVTSNGSWSGAVSRLETEDIGGRW